MEASLDENVRPERVGPYRLMEPIGHGGMGTVCRAWDERLKRWVAIKHFTLSANTTEARQRSWREAQTAARLNHHSIVHIYDLVEDPAGVWIVMELVAGKTLRKLITEEGRLSIAKIITLGLDITEGLAEAHSHGVLHRDLKASNVMVTPADRAKILDFGLAKQVFHEDGAEAQDLSISASGVIAGTSYAMSPEQVLGQSLDNRSDLFSLGSLLYEMTIGEPPFRAATAQASMAAILSLRPPPLVQVRPDVPQELSDLVNRLLEKDCRFRPNAREAATTLANLSGTSVPEDSQPATVPELAPFHGVDRPQNGAETRDPATPVTKLRGWRLRSAGLLILTGILILSAWLPSHFLAPPRSVSKPDIYFIRIQILDPNGRALTKTKILCSAGKPPKLLPNGEWGVVIPAAKVPTDGLISLSAEHEEWEGNQREITLGADPNPRIQISLKVPESWIRGQVVDENSRPLSGVHISRQDGARGETKTDAQGRFVLKLSVRPDALIRLRSELEGWQPGDDFCYAGRASCSILLEKKR